MLIREILFYTLVSGLTTTFALLIIHADKTLSQHGDEYFGVPPPPFLFTNSSGQE